MFRARLRSALPFAIAVALVVLAILARAALDPLLRNRQPFAAFLVASLLAGRYCGFVPSIATIVLGAVASRYFFVAPRYSLELPNSIELGSMGFIVVVSLACSWIIRSEQVVQRKLERERELLRKIMEAQEKEKRFLCHEFHDGLIQYAVGSLMLLESEGLKHATPQLSSLFARVIDHLRRGVEDGRRVIRGIRPAVLDDSGLEAAIDDLIGQFSDSGIMITSKCAAGIGTLPEMIQTTLYRVIQEGLNNARKHSGTDVVRIDVSRSNDDLQLDLRDFGRGFDQSSSGGGGLGLLGMQERVRLLGGRCRIRSELNVGTHISVVLPVA